MKYTALLAAFVVLSSFSCASLAGDLLAQLAGTEGGIAVHLPATDGATELELAQDGSRLVQGLTLDPETAKRARAAIQAKGRYGLATIQQRSDFEQLPYATDLVNLIIVDRDQLGVAAPSEQEVRRVLAPTGVALTRLNGKWAKHVEPIPGDVDQWHHWDHGADGNPSSQDHRVAPTTSLLFVRETKRYAYSVVATVASIAWTPQAVTSRGNSFVAEMSVASACKVSLSQRGRCLVL